MHVHLAPGERLLPGAEAQLDALFARPEVEAVLLPIVPEGDGRLARAARRYMAEWDRRVVHAQNYFAPASRVAARRELPGHRNGDLAPFLADAIAAGRRVEALPGCGVASPLARDLDAWVRFHQAEGAAWGALAAREERFRRFLPATTAAAWWRHNVRQAPRRVVEELEGVRTLAPLPLLLHLTREAAWTGACVGAYRRAVRDASRGTDPRRTDAL